MVSRRKILSRSRDDLNLDQTFVQQEEEEDIWYQKDKLFKEHIQEVLDKWTQIDDEIWAKVIVFERNRRVAKAYARAPVLTINGSDDGFDGMRIGLCGFDNPMRDQKTEEVRRHVGQGVKIKMDDAGNILIRRYAKSNVYVKSTANAQNEETAIGADILKLPNQALESEKIVKLFDMKKFQSNVNRELRRAYPDRRRLETQCLSAIAFVKSESDILDCPVWVLIVNVVAMDMLKSKLPPVQRSTVDMKNRPRIPIPDEDPYSVAGSGGGSSGSSGFGGSAGGAATNGHVAATREQLLLQTQQLAQRRSEKPPKLPPRDNIYPHDIPKPDYDDIEAENRMKTFARGKSDKGKDNKKYDDPYYCGLRARVPNFVKSSKSSAVANKQSDKELIISTISQNGLSQKKTSIAQMPSAMIPQTAAIAPIPLHAIHSHPHLFAAHHNHHQQLMWHARSYESGIGIYSHMNYMLDHHPPSFNCPYREHLVHNGTTTATKPKTTDGRKLLMPQLIQNPYFHMQQNYATGVGESIGSKRERLERYYMSPEPTYGHPTYQGLQYANKWRSESDIFDMDKDDESSKLYEITRSVTSGGGESYIPQLSIATRTTASTLNDDMTSTADRRSKIYDRIYQKKKLSQTRSDAGTGLVAATRLLNKTKNNNNKHRLGFEETLKKSVSTDSFFNEEEDIMQNPVKELYDRLKVMNDDKEFNVQKQKIDKHLKLLMKKDSTNDSSQNCRISYMRARHLVSPPPPMSSADMGRRGRQNVRDATAAASKMQRREHSMYDYRSNGEFRFDSDMESIYGYLKPRKPRSHAIKVISAK